jgi:uncharacterized membrane protein
MTGEMAVPRFQFQLRADKLTWVSRALGLTGLAISTYLLYTYLRHQAPVCVGGSGGCLKVEQSRYARPDGIPMPLFGVLGYLALLSTTFMVGQRARTAGMVLAVCAIGVALLLTYLEVEVIHAICYWCVSSATCAALHVVVNSTRYVRGDPGSQHLREPHIAGMGRIDEGLQS